MTPDDAAPAIEQDQPEVDAPEAPDVEDQPEGVEESDRFTDFDLSTVPEEAREAVEAAEKRMQADYTRKTQTLAEERREAEQERMIVSALRNPDTAPLALRQLGYSEQQILEMLGYDTSGDEDEFDDFDPDERIEKLEQRLSQREQAEEQARREEAVTDYIAEQIEAVEKSKAKRELDAEEQQFIDTFARSNPRPDGTPDVEGAWNALHGILKSNEKRLLGPKTNTPRPPGSGKPGSRAVDLSKETPDERRERMLEAAEISEASSA